MTKIRFFSISLALLLVFSLTSCADNVPQISPIVSTQTSPAMTTDQVDKIRLAIQNTLNNADATNDATGIEARVSGPELKIRRAQVFTKSKLTIQDSNMQIPDSTRQLIVPNDQIRPRSVFVITDITQDRQTERLLVINQDSPRDSYKLWGIVRLFVNKELPKFEVPSIGSGTIMPIDVTLKYEPQDVLTKYASVLELSDTSEFASLFANDQLRKEVFDAHQSAAAQLSSISGTSTETFVANTNEIRAMRTTDGGALMIGEIDSEWTRTTAQGVNAQPASDVEKALFTGKSTTTSITAKYVTVVAIYVPGKASDERIQVVGAERYPIEVNAN